MTAEVAKIASQSFEFGPFRLIPARQLLLHEDVPVRLGSRALDILTALVERSGELISKHELIARAWPNTVVVEDNLKVNVAALRRALGEAAEAPSYIATVSGRGYRFIVPVAVRSGHGSSVEAVASPQGQNLPAGAARVFGRADEIATILADLRRSRLVSIVGAGGVGKTTVAIAVAETFVGVTEDGVWMVDLATLTDPAMVPVAVAAAIGLRTPRAQVLDLLCDHLRERRMVLVFDNCEHVVEAAADCADRLLANAKGLRILATSREPLGVRGERVRTLRGLGVPPVSSSLTAAQALAFPSVQLFVERAAERLEWFTLRDDDAPAAADICRRLDGLALAIELAATRIDPFGVAGLLKQLDDRFRVLIGRRAGPERQRTMTATLDWSYSLLPDEEAGLLCAVSVFAGAFGVEDAAAVAEITPTDAAHRLARLASKSLLATDFDAATVTYRALETTRTYCLDLLRVSGLIDTMQRRHAQHICAVLVRSLADWAHLPAREWGARYGRVLNDLRVAFAWASDKAGEHSLLVNLTAAGTVLWNHLSLTEECRSAVVRAIAALDAADLSGTATEMRLQTFLAGALMFTRGPTPETYEAVRRALEIATVIDDADFHLRIVWMMGGYEVFTGQHAQARDRMRTFLSIAREKDPSAIPAGETMLSLAEFYLGCITNALQHIEHRFRPSSNALEETRLARFQIQTSTQYGVCLGMYQWVAGQPDRAAQTAEAIVRQTLQTGHELSIATALVMSGCPVFLWRHGKTDAHRNLVMLERLVEQHGLETWRPVALYFRGALACLENEVPVEGIDMLKRAMADLDAIQHRSRSPYFLGTLADAFARTGRLAEAAATIEAALDRARVQGEAWCAPELLRIKASVLVAGNRSEEAEAVLSRSIALAQESGALSWRLRAGNDLARLWHAKARSQDARNMLLPIYEQFNEGHDTYDLRISRDLLASIDDMR